MSEIIGNMDAITRAIFDAPATEPETYIPDGWRGMLMLNMRHMPDYEKARSDGAEIEFTKSAIGMDTLYIYANDGTAEDVSHWLHQPILELRVKRAELEHIAAKYVTP